MGPQSNMWTKHQLQGEGRGKEGSTRFSLFVMYCIKGLVTNYGEGGGKMEGGACEVLPLRKGGGGGKSFSHAEGGHKFWGSFYAVA